VWKDPKGRKVATAKITGPTECLALGGLGEKGNEGLATTNNARGKSLRMARSQGGRVFPVQGNGRSKAGRELRTGTAEKVQRVRLGGQA